MTIFSYGNKTATTSLVNHLKDVHEIILEAAKEQGQQTLNFIGAATAKPRVVSEKPVQNNGRIDQITDALAYFIGSEPNVSAEMTSREPFQYFCNVLYDQKLLKPAPIPCPNTIRKHMVKKYESAKESTIKYLEEKAPEALAIIFDIWTDSTTLKRSFLGVQVQFSIDMKITNINLKTVHMTGKKTGESIANTIFGIHSAQQVPNPWRKDTVLRS